MFTQSFSAVTPPARYDAVPWTLVRVEEAVTVDGVFTLITSMAVAADSTPATPAPVAVTVTSATLEVGFYRFQFVDGAGNTAPFTAPVRAPTLTGSQLAYIPSLTYMGALLRARTKDANGDELGTFTATTRPTDAQVLALIDLAAAEVATRINEEFRVRYVESARSVIALRTAMHIEVSYFPEETESRDSAFARFSRQYNDAVQELTEATGPLGLILG